jgi:hypothetical protein
MAAGWLRPLVRLHPVDQGTQAFPRRGSHSIDDIEYLPRARLVANLEDVSSHAHQGCGDPQARDGAPA